MATKAKKGRQGEGGGRPPHQPTESSRNDVRTLAKYGAAHATIAAAFKICLNTLKTHYSEELEIGRAQGDVVLLETQFMRATRDGDVGMLRWLGIQRLGQRSEVKVESENTGRDQLAEALNKLADKLPD